MKILLCTIPDGSLDPTGPLIPRKGTSSHPSLTFPLGILRVMQAAEKEGYKSTIYDINNLRPTDEEIIEHLKRVKPDVIGLSAVFLHCYPHQKL